MSNKVFYDDVARAKVIAGAGELYGAVKTTLGPKGRSVVISRAYGNPIVTKDGVTVAKNINLADDEDNLGYKVGAELIKQAASKMNDEVGDGTTTITVLTYHILQEANRLIASGHSPIQLRKGLEAAAKEVLTGLTELSEDITGNTDRVTQVASISATDEEIGSLVSDVINKIGKDGVVTVEAGQGLELESEVVEGFTFDRGYVSPYMVTDNARMEAVYNNPAIVITDKKVSNIQEFLPLLEKIAQTGTKDLVLIAEELEGEALGTLILNRIKGIFNTVAVKAPSFGENRKEVLEDIATLVGGKVINSESGYDFSTATLDVVGTAKKVIVSKDETTIISGGGTQESVDSRISNIKTQAENAKSDYEKEGFEKRTAALSGKVAVIKVGGATETEIEEKKFRVDDAVAAVKAALAGGIVAGGGVTLVNLIKAITVHHDDSDSVAAGKNLLKKALEQPFRILLANSDLSGDEWLPQVKQMKTGFGLNITSEDQTHAIDLKEAGIIDPTNVTKEVVQNAVSIAGTAITMGALVVEVPDKQPENPGMMPGMM